MIIGIQYNYYKKQKKLYMIGFFLITIIISIYNPKKKDNLI